MGSIDFLTKKLVIEQTYAENDTDFIIADSLIKAFKNVYSNTQTTINDYNIWEEYYKECMEIIHNKAEYADEYIEECNNFINICNLRNIWTKHFN